MKKTLIHLVLAVTVISILPMTSSLAALGYYSEEPAGSSNRPSAVAFASQTLADCLSGGSVYRDVQSGSSTNPIITTYKKGYGKITNYTGGKRFYIRVYLGETNYYVDTGRKYYTAGTSSTLKQYTSEYKIPVGVGRHDAAHQAIAKCGVG